MALNLNGYGAYSATVGTEPLQNMITLEDRREERLQQDRALFKEKEEANRQKAEDLKIGTIKFDTSRLNPLLNNDATAYSNEAFSKIADAISHSKTSTDRMLAVDKVTQEFATNMQNVYNESAQLNQIDPNKNPNAAQLLSTNPGLALASQALQQSGYDKEKFQNLLATVPDPLNEFSYFKSSDPNHDPNKPLRFSITAPKQTDWTQLATNIGKNIKGTKLNYQDINGVMQGYYGLSDDKNSQDNQALKSGVETATHGDIGGFNNWIATKGYYDPSIWVNGKPPIKADGTTNVNAQLDKQKAIEKYNEDFTAKAKSEMPISYFKATAPETFEQRLELARARATSTGSASDIREAWKLQDENASKKIADANKIIEGTYEVKDILGVPTGSIHKSTSQEIEDAKSVKEQAMEEQKEALDGLKHQEGISEPKKNKPKIDLSDIPGATIR